MTIFHVVTALIIAATVCLWISPVCLADDLVKFEAEAGGLGAEIAINNSGSPVYITALTNNSGSNPGNATRVASYTINFPSAGTYQLFARLRVGSGGFDDDSMFYASSFGAKTPALNSDWVLANGLAGVGYTVSSDVVGGAGNSGNQVWKWIDLSQFTGNGGFTVSAGNLAQTFQIGTRENGLALDKFVFGTIGTPFTVSNLDTGTLPTSNLNTNIFSGPDGVTIHRFSAVSHGLNLDGANPAAGLSLINGVLYGTTLNGGALGSGTAFRVTTDGTNFSAFRAFTNAPDAGLVQGNLTVSGSGYFGTSLAGGDNEVGAVFAGNTNGSITLIRSFDALSADTATNAGGASPNGLLALSGNALYGTTTAGGTAANGTVFSVSTNGSGFAVRRTFSQLDSKTGTNTDGALPCGGLTVSGSTLYGTASAGGAGGAGVVFSMATNGGSFTILHHFTSLDALTATNSDGAFPLSGLALSSGMLYGTTIAGGTGGKGVIFCVGTNGLNFSALHHFNPTDPASGTNTGGASPIAPLLLSSNVLFGTASAGGTGAAGTVFSLNLEGNKFHTLHSFTALAASGTNAYGAFPVAPLLRLGNSLFGTVFSGGPGASGTVFRLLIPPPPAIITSISPNADGTVTLQLLGGPNSTNVVQAASNLEAPSDWQNVATNIADSGGAWQFSENINHTIRFYRSYAP
jgi:uncharacterized repeat protein (TIGR03803 family)